MDVQGDQRASLSSLSGDSASIVSRYRISKGQAADARAKRFIEGALSPGRGGCDHGCTGPGVGYLTIGSGWFFDLAGTVSSGVGAQVSDRIMRVR